MTGSGRWSVGGDREGGVGGNQGDRPEPVVVCV